MSRRYSSLNVGTGSLLKTLSQTPAPNVFNHQVTTRHLSLKDPFSKSPLSIYSKSVSLGPLVYDDAQELYRQHVLNILTLQGSSTAVKTVWQEYVSVDGVSWVYNRDYNVDGIASILSLDHVFQDVKNIYGFGQDSFVYTLTTPNGKINAYSPALGVAPVSDNNNGSYKFDLYLNEISDYISLTLSGNALSVTSNNSGTITCNITETIITTDSGNPVTTFVKDENSVIRFGCVIAFNSQDLGFLPLTDGHGKLSNSQSLAYLSSYPLSSCQETGLSFIKATNTETILNSIPSVLFSLSGNTVTHKFPESLKTSFPLSGSAYPGTSGFNINSDGSITLTIESNGQDKQNYVRTINGYSNPGYSYLLELHLTGTTSGTPINIYLPTGIKKTVPISLSYSKENDIVLSIFREDKNSLVTYKSNSRPNDNAVQALSSLDLSFLVDGTIISINIGGYILISVDVTPVLDVSEPITIKPVSTATANIANLYFD